VVVEGRHVDLRHCHLHFGSQRPDAAQTDNHTGLNLVQMLD
jgi:hypothetical protein